MVHITILKNMFLQTISSSNGIDYYYNNALNATDLTSVIGTSNTSSVSFTHPFFPVMLEGTNGVYRTYKFFSPWGMDRQKYTIKLSSNGVDKTYYLYVKGSTATSYT